MKAHRMLITILVLGLLAGCGYTIQRSIESVHIGKLTNKTFEPKVTDRLTEALTRSFTKHGIKVAGASPYELQGTVDEVQIKPDAVRDNVAISYKVTLACTFTLKGPDGKSRVLQHGNDFIVSYLSTGSIQDVIAAKDAAMDKALEDLADKLTFSLLEDSK